MASSLFLLTARGYLSRDSVLEVYVELGEYMRRPVHFLVISIIARQSIFYRPASAGRPSSVGNTDLALVTFRRCLLNPSIAFVVYISFLISYGYLKYVLRFAQFSLQDLVI